MRAEQEACDTRRPRKGGLLRAAAVGFALGPLLAGCAGGDGTAGSPAASTASPSRSATDELTFDQARDLGLLRDDTLTVDAPSDLATGGGTATVTVTVTLPAQVPDRRIELDHSGDCSLSPGAPRSVTVPAGAWRISASFTAAVPAGRSDCFLQVDALFPGRPYTGDGATVTFRR